MGVTVKHLFGYTLCLHQKYEIETIELSNAQIRKNLKEAWKALRKIQKQDRKHSDQYLQDLVKLHSTFVSLPFMYGFSLSRWQQSLHVMLQKLSDPYIHKLQTVQLFDIGYHF